MVHKQKKVAKVYILSSSIQIYNTVRISNLQYCSDFKRSAELDLKEGERESWLRRGKQEVTSYPSFSWRQRAHIPPGFFVNGCFMRCISSPMSWSFASTSLMTRPLSSCLLFGGLWDSLDNVSVHVRLLENENGGIEGVGEEGSSSPRCTWDTILQESHGSLSLFRWKRKR